MQSTNPSSRRYPAELKERAVRLVEQTRAEGGGEVGIIARVARQLGVGDQWPGYSPNALRICASSALLRRYARLRISRFP
jgi:hypothetical protein